MKTLTMHKALLSLQNGDMPLIFRMDGSGAIALEATKLLSQIKSKIGLLTENNITEAQSLIETFYDNKV